MAAEMIPIGVTQRLSSESQIKEEASLTFKPVRSKKGIVQVLANASIKRTCFEDAGFGVGNKFILCYDRVSGSFKIVNDETNGVKASMVSSQKSRGARVYL
jgi:hypothetical protein